MATKYLLPCECGRSVPIDPGQAGQSVSCDCGQMVEAPSMRAIRGLEPVPDAAAHASPAGQWNAAAGSAFAGGALLTIVGLVVVGFATVSHSLLKRNLPVRSDALVQQWLGEIDDSTPSGLLKIWNETLSRGFRDYDDSPWKEFQEESQKYIIIGGIGAALAAAGVAVAFSSRFLRGK